MHLALIGMWAPPFFKGLISRTITWQTIIFYKIYSLQYRKYNVLWFHGSHFCVEKVNKNFIRYDCGVMATFEQEQSSTNTSKTRLDYCGIIQDILEINYKKFSFFVLDVKWFKVVKSKRGAMIHQDLSGFFSIDSKAIWRNKEDTFVFPHQCKHVLNIFWLYANLYSQMVIELYI